MSRFYTFLVMFGFWIILSGKFDIFHLTLGVISCVIVSALSADLLFHDTKKKVRPSEIFRFMLYIPWLLYEIVLATFHVAYIALHPRMMDLIEPRIVVFKTRLKKDISQVTLANSIILTPGTITVKVTEGNFYVHAISKKTAEGLPGEMEERIAKVFAED